MTKKELIQLRKLAEHCRVLLLDPLRQSERVFRGDMRAIVAACAEVEKARTSWKSE